MLGKIKRLAFPLLCLAVCSILFVVGLTNRRLIQGLRDQGRDYVSVTPVAQPRDGVDGRSAYQVWLDNGNTGSELDFLESLKGKDAIGINQQQIQAAVNVYCANGVCDGKNPTQAQVTAAVATMCPDSSCQGIPGANATPEMVATAVANFCANNNGCRGGIGATGPAGTDGRTPFFSCVLRWDAEIEGVTRYWEAWKYTDEPNSAYRNLKRIPSQDRPSQGECVDLREPQEV